MSDVFKFLLGEGPLDGVWFGERPEGERGDFWWRKHLRAEVERLTKANENYDLAREIRTSQAVEILQRHIEGLDAQIERLRHERDEATAKMQIMQGMMVAAFDQRDAIRLETIERCKQACEGQASDEDTGPDEFWSGWNNAALGCAAAIEALK